MPVRVRPSVRAGSVANHIGSASGGAAAAGGPYSTIGSTPIHTAATATIVLTTASDCATVSIARPSVMRLQSPIAIDSARAFDFQPDPVLRQAALTGENGWL